MPRRRLTVLLVILAVPATAHAELSVTTPPADLAPTLALTTVTGLASAPGAATCTVVCFVESSTRIVVSPTSRTSSRRGGGV